MLPVNKNRFLVTEKPLVKIAQSEPELRDSKGGTRGTGKSPRKVGVVESMKWYYHAHLVLILNAVFSTYLILAQQALTLC